LFLEDVHLVLDTTFLFGKFLLLLDEVFELTTHGSVALANSSSFSVVLLFLDESFLLVLDLLSLGFESVKFTLKVFLLRFVLDDVLLSRECGHFSLRSDFNAQIVFLA